ncbi:hypothetical protein JCM10213v2_003312 [Rhodosporidiobolus nylandii]
MSTRLVERAALACLAVATWPILRSLPRPAQRLLVHPLVRLSFILIVCQSIWHFGLRMSGRLAVTAFSAVCEQDSEEQSASRALIAKAYVRLEELARSSAAFSDKEADWARAERKFPLLRNLDEAARLMPSFPSLSSPFRAVIVQQLHILDFPSIARSAAASLLELPLSSDNPLHRATYRVCTSNLCVSLARREVARAVDNVRSLTTTQLLVIASGCLVTLLHHQADLDRVSNRLLAAAGLPVSREEQLVALREDRIDPHLVILDPDNLSDQQRAFFQPVLLWRTSLADLIAQLPAYLSPRLPNLLEQQVSVLQLERAAVKAEESLFEAVLDLALVRDEVKREMKRVREERA